MYSKLTFSWWLECLGFYFLKLLDPHNCSPNQFPSVEMGYNILRDCGICHQRHCCGLRRICSSLVEHLLMRPNYGLSSTSHPSMPLLQHPKYLWKIWHLPVSPCCQRTLALEFLSLHVWEWGWGHRNKGSQQNAPQPLVFISDSNSDWSVKQEEVFFSVPICGHTDPKTKSGVSLYAV